MENYTKMQGKALNFNDFARIGGEIVSAPLNENFRRLVNGLSLSNTNLIFPAENATIPTVEDMTSIENPLDGQTCYVISNGSLYRFSKRDNQWYKIADFGQTFRQGFLNSGVVVSEDEIKLIDEMKIRIPKMLVYFKNQEGDGRYLKGMYLLEERIINLKNDKDKSVEGITTAPGSYSLLVDVNQHFQIIAGMPKEDSPNWIYLGSFLIIKNNGAATLLQDFIFTIPDIAYTADRGQFFLKNGDYTGLSLTASSEKNKINRKAGFYYEEGISFTKGQTDNFPIDTDSGSNFNVKAFGAVEPVQKVWYASPINMFKTDIIESIYPTSTESTEGEPIANTGLFITNKIINADGKSEELKNGEYSIQNHLVLPNGTNIVLYGTEKYHSKQDAISNLNKTQGIIADFPFIEATRIVIGNLTEEFDISNSEHCGFYTLERLAQVGTIDPHFADDQFMLFVGHDDDLVPSTLRFSLSELEKESRTDVQYYLAPLSVDIVRPGFSLGEKFIRKNGTEIETVKIDEPILEMRSYDGLMGYKIADDTDLQILANRIADIEKEIWSIPEEESNKYEQSIRYRLDNNETKLSTYDQQIANLENNKVDKTTTINGHGLNANITLTTGDIQEGTGLNGKPMNEWYTADKVAKHTNVKTAYDHSQLKGTATVTNTNPHGMATEDITVKENSDRQFVTAAEKSRININKIPENTIDELSKKIENVRIESLAGNSLNPGANISTLGNVKAVRFYQDGVNLSVNEATETLTIECVGQTDYERMLLKQDFATKAMENPDKFAGYVDRALDADFANNIYGVTEAGENKYYGTNGIEEIGFFDLPTYVTTTEAEDFAEINQVIFVPVDGSVTEEHLEETLRNKIINNYHTIQDDGEIKSSEINTINFGNNLHVDVDGNTVTINATGTDGEAISKFVNLDDVEITYTNNGGRVVVVNEEETGLTTSEIPSLDEIMLKTTYVDSTDPYKVKHAALADSAVNATSAGNALTVSGIEVNNNVEGNTLWTSEMIVNYIANNTPAILSGTEIPTTEQGKDGDIYILLGE